MSPQAGGNGHLLNNVALRKPSEVGVFWAARRVRAMTKPAGEHIGLAAVSYNIWQWPMVVWVPDRRDESVPELGPGIAGGAVRHAHRITIVGRRLVVGIVLRISPPRR